MIDSLLKILDQQFPDPQPPLRHRSVFELLVAVILSAQCTDERVNQITPGIFPADRPCTPEDILALGLEELRKRIYSCTYANAKSKNITETARILSEKGFVPSEFEELVKLPGVGAKTAQVIQSQWFHKAAFPVDTHVHRVCNRLGIANSGTNRDKTERQVKAAVPPEHWSKLHLQLIYHGRKTCTAYKPKCGSCPLFEICQWPNKELLAGLSVAALPKPNSKKNQRKGPSKDN